MVENFLKLANNIQGIALFSGYSADLYQEFTSINCAQFCDGSPTEFCENILEGVLSEGIFKPLSKLIEIYTNSESVNYVPQIPYESFFSRSLSNALRSISDKTIIIMNSIINDERNFLISLGTSFIVIFSLLLLASVFWGVPYVITRYIQS